MSDAIRSRIAGGEVALGLIVRMVRSGEIARIARASGHDFLFIDCQHAAFSPAAVDALIQSALGCGLAAVVRIRQPEDLQASIWLDCGATGIVAPDLRSADEARRFVELCRFPPLGKRSFGGPAPHNDYASIDPATELAEIDRRTLCIGMVETAEAVSEIDAIAATPGLDILHVGFSDLSIALGTPGNVASPQVREAFAAISAAARKHGKVVGIGGDRDPERRKSYLAAGAQFATTNTDISLLLTAASETVAGIRGGR